MNCNFSLIQRDQQQLLLYYIAKGTEIKFASQLLHEKRPELDIVSGFEQLSSRQLC